LQLSDWLNRLPAIVLLARLAAGHESQSLCVR
jgi:hypothetical protein